MRSLLRALGREVKARREQLGLSQDEFALRAGLHRTYISDIEHGKRNVTVDVLKRLSDALECDPSTLVSRAEKLMNKR